MRPHCRGIDGCAGEAGGVRQPPCGQRKWEGMLSRIPPITTRVMDGRELIAWQDCGAGK